ncbi:MAG TPA: ABC transporter ATP-binding protein [Pseudolabrys sp.]|nr:ABC transporter ATP-binding protein [Pseudolabrys sp.]
MTSLIEIENLKVTFRGDRDRTTHAVEAVSFDLAQGVTLGLVGESGCGKSVTALAIMGLLPKGSADVSGYVGFEGNNLLDLTDAAMRDLRGDRLAMIFQEPMTSLNPSYTIGEQIIETLVRHRAFTRTQARTRAIELLRDVRIPSPEMRVDEYPHKLSGGMRQRAMVAIALACDPQLLIADEPTTALDVTIQAQVLDLMRSLKEKTNAAIVLISHDLGVVAEICDEVAVMYAGEIVEHAPVDVLFKAPQHPYTIGLLASLPRLDRRVETLATIEGSLPDMSEIPQGCRFAPRCPFASEACVSHPPPIVDVGARHWSRCVKAPLEGIAA